MRKQVLAISWGSNIFTIGGGAKLPRSQTVRMGLRQQRMRCVPDFLTLISDFLTRKILSSVRIEA